MADVPQRVGPLLGGRFRLEEPPQRLAELVRDATAVVRLLRVRRSQVELQLESHPLHEADHVQDLPDRPVVNLMRGVEVAQPTVLASVRAVQAVAVLPGFRQEGRVLVDRSGVARRDPELQLVQPGDGHLERHHRRRLVRSPRPGQCMLPAVEQAVLRGVRGDGSFEQLVVVAAHRRGGADRPPSGNSPRLAPRIVTCDLVGVGVVDLTSHDDNLLRRPTRRGPKVWGR